MAADAMITDVVGVIIWTEDVTRLAAFYRDTLGLPVHSERADFVAFDLPHGRRLSIGRHSRVRGRALDPYRIMLNLGVRDIQEAHRDLTGRGVTFVREPERENWGGWIATLADPDGNMLQLFQLPPAGCKVQSVNVEASMSTTYWVYENWRADSKAIIHRANCPSCQNGKGVHAKKQEGRNGKWHGPFLDYDAARAEANRLHSLGRRIADCKRCH